MFKSRKYSKIIFYVSKSSTFPGLEKERKNSEIHLKLKGAFTQAFLKAMTSTKMPTELDKPTLAVFALAPWA
jgi:hypothetical protein